MGLGKDTAKRAQESLEADREQAARLPELLASVAEAQDGLNEAQAQDAPMEELHRTGMELDTALTEAMRAAYAKERALIGSKGYTDRIYRRKRLATPKVRRATEVAEQLLTAREQHRLHGIERVPRAVV